MVVSEQLLASRDIALGQRTAVKVWDIESGKERLSWGKDVGGFQSICFSPDGKTLVTVCHHEVPQEIIGHNDSKDRIRELGAEREGAILFRDAPRLLPIRTHLAIVALGGAVLIQLGYPALR